MSDPANGNNHPRSEPIRQVEDPNELVHVTLSFTRAQVYEILIRFGDGNGFQQAFDALIRATQEECPHWWGMYRSTGDRIP